MPIPLAIVVLAAGEGTRMKSSTPKVLHKISGKTLLEHVLTTAKNANPNEIVLVVGHASETISKYGLDCAEKNSFDLQIATQENPLGTGDAVASAMEKLKDFNGNIVVLSADVPLLDAKTVKALVKHQNSSSAAVATILTTNLQDPTGYGRVVRDKDGTVLKIVEHKDASQKELDITEINSGIYVFNSNFLREALPQLKPNNSQSELYLTDTISIARKSGKIVLGNHIEDSVLVTGCNDRWQLSQLAIVSNQRILKKHMLNGVSIIDPQTTWIDTGVTIGQDSVINPGTQIFGKTSIGTNCEIGPDTTLSSSNIENDVKILKSYVLESNIKSKVTIGPFAHLRANSNLLLGSKVGTFVETKNSTIGENSKVPHLSYVGDTVIGENSNLGAGTIVANYDGINKHQSSIGNNVKIGANTVIVSPVEISDEIYTGAGTIVRSDIPKDSLVVPDSKFRIIKNWVSKNRKNSLKKEKPE